MISKASMGWFGICLLAGGLHAQVGPDGPSTGPPASSGRGAAKEADQWRTPSKGRANKRGPEKVGRGEKKRSANGLASTGRTQPEVSLADLQVSPKKAAVPVRSGGRDMLPNDQGQVWRQYDISEYTSRAAGVDRPEQAVIDWILRETGSDAWFHHPLGLLSADASRLSVYHTPEMQEVVADVVGRFVHGSLDAHVLGLHLVTLSSPNWRTRFLQRLQPITVRSPGIDAWLLSQEDAAMLLAELRRRSDFHEHAEPNLVFYNGQPNTIRQMRPRKYVRSYQSRITANGSTPMAGGPGVEAQLGELQEGFSIQISPLLSQDERTIDAVVKCDIDQVERLVSVPVDVPGFNGQIQRANIQVPQLVSWRLHERFRWPASQVLLLSCGVIASPGPEQATTLGIPNLFSTRAGRADALMFIQARGKANQALLSGGRTAVGSRAVPNRGRY